MPFSSDFAAPSYSNGYPAYPSLPNPNIPAHQPLAPMAMPEIRTEADLALFNQFMISLGRDVANTQHAPTNLSMVYGHAFGSHGSASSGSSPPLSEQSPLEDLFNPEELASLGLTGMPGIPPQDLGPASTQDNSNSMPSAYGLYPTLGNMHQNRARGFSAPDLEDVSKRAIASLPRTMAQSVPTPKPQYLSNIYGLGPTPYAELPSFVSNHEMGHTALGPTEHHYASFDSLARSKNHLPPATLAPKQFYKKTYRHVAPLGAAVSSRSRESAERTEIEEPEEMDEEEGERTPKISVRSLLLSDEQADPTLKLPAIHSDQEEAPGRTVLPPLIDLAPSPSTNSPRPSSPLRQLPVKRHTEDEILRGVKRLELSEDPRPREGKEGMKEMRKRHTMMIRAWLVAVNLDWRRRTVEKIDEGTQRENGGDEEVRNAGEWEKRGIGMEAIFVS